MHTCVSRALMHNNNYPLRFLRSAELMAACIKHKCVASIVRRVCQFLRSGPVVLLQASAADAHGSASAANSFWTGLRDMAVQNQ